MVALLHQAGRLPLVPSQRAASEAIANAMKTALLWAKKENPGVGWKAVASDLKVSQIPDHFELEATLDIALPQDQLQEANLARTLSDGENPLVPQRYVREKVLNAGQSDDLQEEIWSEQAARVKAAMHFQQMMQMAQQPPPGQQPPPPMQGQGGPPEMHMQGGLPPEMAMNGQQPPDMAPGMEGPPMEGMDYAEY
jgi:hypothetical protein